jgi:hypothetical protein
MEVYGEERGAKALIPKWTEQVKAKIASNSTDCDIFQVNCVVDLLSVGEKEALIYIMLRKAVPRWNITRTFEANVGVGWAGNDAYFAAKKLCADCWGDVSNDCKKNFDFTKDEIKRMNESVKAAGGGKPSKFGGLFGKK